MEGDRARFSRNGNGPVLDDSDSESEEPEMWKMMNKSFKEVERVLDRNRLLIKQVNENHQSKIPDNLVKNVDLINQINSNITHVVSLYSHLSDDLSSACRGDRQGNSPPPRSNDSDIRTPSQ